MTRTDDPMKIVNDLKPLKLDQMAGEGYSRRRQSDLARAVARDSESAATGPAPRGHRSPWPGRRRWSLLAGGVAVTAAAAMAAVVVASGRPASRQQAPTAAALPGPRAVLLASAETAARAPANEAGYWYVRERSWNGTATLKKQEFGATYGSTEESWTGSTRSRTIVNENAKFAFASAADEARWEAAGKPKLVTGSGTDTGPRTSNYEMSPRIGSGTDTLTWGDVLALPTTAAELGKKLRRMWDTTQDKAAAVGFPHPSYGQYLVAWAGNLLAGPATPGTKAAMYRLLARQPAITITHGITDPAGREGIAIADGGGDYLVIDPHTASVLDFTSNPVHPGERLPAASGLTLFQAAGWVKQLGIPAEPLAGPAT